MADNSKIEWTDATWNPITGCTIRSPGCANCFAMLLAGTRLKHHWSRIGLTRETKAGPVWTGEVRFNEEWLGQPLRWRRPRMIFVCAHGDLFAPGVPDAWIDRVFAAMVLASQHTFQVLTKRPERMRAYLSDPRTPGRIARVLVDEALIAKRWRIDPASWPVRTIGDVDAPDDIDVALPLPHVWLGFSAEDQTRFDERAAHAEPLAKRGWLTWCSAEPLLGPIDMGGAVAWLRWVVAGGENGPRPMHPDWARGLRDQCAANGVPFHFKQWGSWVPTKGVDTYSYGPQKNERRYPNAKGISWLRDGRICLRHLSVIEHAARIQRREASSTHAVEVDHTALADLYASLEEPGRTSLGYEWMYCVGKRAAGRLLDGRTHDEFPAIAGRGGEVSPR